MSGLAKLIRYWVDLKSVPRAFHPKIKLSFRQKYGNGVWLQPSVRRASDVPPSGYFAMARGGVVIRATLGHRRKVPLLIFPFPITSFLANTPQESGKPVTSLTFPRARMLLRWFRCCGPAQIQVHADHRGRQVNK
jgi:hypothetical protein